MKPNQLTDKYIIEFALRFLGANLNNETASMLLRRTQPVPDKTLYEVSDRLQVTIKKVCVDTE